jgi:hypothetical protein
MPERWPPGVEADYPAAPSVVVVDHAVLHDHPEVFLRIGEEVDVLEQIAINEKIGESAHLHNAEPAGIRRTRIELVARFAGLG